MSHSYRLLSSVADYSKQVLVRTTLKHATKMTFPAVTICNVNPIKSSLLSNNPRLEALVASWGVGDRRRRRRDVSDDDGDDVNDVVSRQRRTVGTAPNVTCKSLVVVSGGNVIFNDTVFERKSS